MATGHVGRRLRAAHALVVEDVRGLAGGLLVKEQGVQAQVRVLAPAPPDDRLGVHEARQGGALSGEVLGVAVDRLEAVDELGLAMAPAAHLDLADKAELVVEQKAQRLEDLREGGIGLVAEHPVLGQMHRLDALVTQVVADRQEALERMSRGGLLRPRADQGQELRAGDARLAALEPLAAFAGDAQPDAPARAFDGGHEV